MGELRVGGLAVIIQSRIQENIGATVRLLKNLGVVSGVTENIEFEAWQVESCSGGNLKGYLPGGLVIKTPVVNCPAKWLMPIDGEDFSHEDEHEKELTHG
ncbi:Uncharacterised protein [Cedecea lapagei]|uniref:Uncharacterized protein n=1 Tax=Cedecea lapagei TaxID=158823 RepID=A0A3S4MG32_9ENTR|nr:hypothetical protein [Cedecea lapagei]VEB97321.1 Uncharacterised protein [Cedecea lapagei]VEB99994.1 Uncharacterised protein [Cedecea lapagei]